MKKIFFFFFLQVNTAIGVEVLCNFEEVYSNGDIQQGMFLLKDEKLRYEYHDKDLFTIIAKNGKFFLINQSYKNNVSRLNENTEILEMFVNIASEYPNLKNRYNYENSNIIIEKSSNSFIKRVSINSENINVSINLIDCKFETIHDKYFNHFNFEEIKR